MSGRFRGDAPGDLVGTASGYASSEIGIRNLDAARNEATARIILNGGGLCGLEAAVRGASFAFSAATRA